jgi:probable HAF family extracellular repeat protein
MRSGTRYTLALLVLCLAAFAAQTSVQYKFYPAGNFPGAVTTAPLACSREHIVGYYQVTGGLHAYIQTGTSFKTAEPAGSSDSYLSGINGHGLAVGGFCPQGCNDYSGQYGYTYSYKTGKMQTISFPLKGASTTAYGINDEGTIVGGYCPNALSCPQGAFSPASDGFMETNGVFITLDYPGAQDTSALAVNNSGAVVGDYIINNTGPHAFLYQNGTFTNIDFPGSNFTVASGINNYGVVAGFFTTTAGALHGFTYSNSTFTQIDRPDSPKGSGVNGINDRGDLVGLWYPSIGFPKTFKAIPVAGPELP